MQGGRDLSHLTFIYTFSMWFWSIWNGNLQLFGTVIY